MADDKFLDIISKLQKGEQPKVQSPSSNSNQEGLKTLNEGFKTQNFTLNKDEGHRIEISTKDQKKD